MKLLKLSIWKCRGGVRAWQTEAIPAALDMAFGCADLKYVILGEGDITCKVQVTSRKRKKKARN